MAKSIEAEVKRLMATGMTEAEARETAEYDLAVENGEATEFDLTAEQQKVAKKYTNTGTKKRTEYQFSKRERKPNETKREIMNLVRIMFEGMALNGKCEAVDLSNIERTLDFVKDGKHYTLTLTEHRPPKA
jgi:hypothetical protein